MGLSSISVLDIFRKSFSGMYISHNYKYVLKAAKNTEPRIRTRILILEEQKLFFERMMLFPAYSPHFSFRDDADQSKKQRMNIE
jgi:hypothetical protein